MWTKSIPGMTQSEQASTIGTHSGDARGTVSVVTLRGEPAWGGLTATATSRTVNGTAAPGTGRQAGTGTQPATTGGLSTAAAGSVEELEAQVYATRDLHGDERGAVRRLLSQARGRMSEDTYRRALVLARDSALLTVEECLDGARAMEWQPLPRPEFSLATIEAAVEEQERHAGTSGL